MAAEIGTSYKEQYVFRSEVVYPEDAARIEARTAFRRAHENKWSVELSHIKPVIEHRSVSMVPPYGPEHFPRAVRLTRGRGLNDFAGYTQGGPSVSARLKDLIEKIEPGVHRFFPVEVQGKDGSPYGRPYWYFVVMQVIDAIRPGGGVASTSDRPMDGRHSWTLSGPRDRDHLAVNKEVIAGRATWRDIRLPGGSFISDALLEGMRAQNMTGYDILSEWAET
jgi:hypothetical protein